MSKEGKLAVLLAISILAASSIMTIQSAQAETNLSVPEFTIELLDESYDVPPTTKSTTNYYTNETTTTTIPGYHVQNPKFKISIKNQLYPTTINGSKAWLIYQIQMKPHFVEDWANAENVSSGLDNNSKFTNVSIRADYDAGYQIDFRVNARIEYEHTIYSYYRLPVFGSDVRLRPLNVTDIYDLSDWSPTQTFKMPDINPTQTNPTLISLSIDVLLEIFTIIAIVALLLAVICLLLYKKNHRTTIVTH